MFDFEGGPVLSIGGEVTYQKTKWKIKGIKPINTGHEGLVGCVLDVVLNY